ncbi:hypothetical protein GOBAR_AA07354 [Gossypium barbadense]|uniref:Uncharacterized protein n=1 Tax=Gossypium barbadense TaxID=3634 RepID=A0A2P5YCL9_GOSBA|nr:hypothetical protein GOBAR_AA07354 [Gossypium barbadense]
MKSETTTTARFSAYLTAGEKPNLEEMLTKFISMSETRFQNTKTTLKNQQASFQGLETQIGQLAKLISERPQRSLPSNIETNPRKQCYHCARRRRVGDKVLLDEADPHVATSEPNGAIPFVALNIFPFGTVEVTHSKFGTFKVQ